MLMFLRIATLASIIAHVAIALQPRIIWRGRIAMASMTPKAKLPSLSIPKVLNPLDWSPERVAKSKEIEGVEHFRLVGVSPDAPYEEIQEKQKQLETKYDKDIKKKVKIQIACDKIVELRLRQASTGDLGKTSETIAMERKDDFQLERQKKSNSKSPLPKILKGKFDPTKARFIHCAKYTLLPGLVVSTFVAEFAPYVMGYMALATANMLYGRDRPKKKTDDGGFRNFTPPPKKEFQPMALLTVVGLGSGALFAQAIAQVIPYSESLLLACISFTAWLTTSSWRILPKKAVRTK